ncbi:DUF2971 domain-containing protein [Stutzerimonas nitrititolerans]|uniref:DUF2971 domain-containing protein n=1 Tax=Stutzerimonas nitrititolerans TaxID=2482751 RepID=UPI0028AB030D|nr:DUF2971 domain-containing protein [Stutzerimonas nitrititolerans]
MATVKLGSSITGQHSLWRYMSIDKLINLLEVKSLYFTPLSYYAKSDPFEGYLPKVAFEALATVLGSSYKELETVYSQLNELAENSRKSGAINTIGEELLAQLRTRLDSQNDFIKEAYKTIAKGITVNCWHRNPQESEAMWRLYSENGKGIAIKTSIDSLKKSIESVDQNLLVQVGTVKYLDFNDQNISPKDCVIDGHLSPLLKRASFSHENEVRLFTIPEIDYKSLGGFEPKAQSVALNIEELIEEIYISPFASEPFVSSTIAICKKYGINPRIITKSTLLDGHEELLDTLGVW